ncbi:hypothetical protein CLV28_2920 [Sediminihabitans luteus]|uniref:Sporulation protein YtfJ n=1 Tax=Sediminihabitans luteus TaxID=1138585 RepID=A0A2M9CCM7_9CELL|nr:hypothetical protein [Sediminihabitans luteus]PJJ69110.1 hypothetical protein CLV28_2920 [Sediminihabitans luteus]GII99496.1 hypothetical protein Slu03_18740 [Sediminihabitans luteus]
MTDDTRSFSPDLSRLTQAADDSFSVRRAFGEPYEHAGSLVVPVAKVWGLTGTGSGGGAGAGTGSGTGQGSGGGTGRSTGSGSGSASFRFPRRGPAVTADDAEPGQDLATASDGRHVGTSSSDGTRGEANGEATGEAKGEARGEANGEAHGEGGGGGGAYGVRVKALGAYVVGPDGAVRWQPALDLNRVVLGGQIVLATGALALGWALGRRRRH